MRIVRSSETYNDFIAIAEYLGKEDPSVALRFWDAYEASLQILGKSPKIGSPRRSRSGEAFRIWFVKGFENILIIYRDSKNEILILRVIHSARDYTRFT